MIPSPKHSSPAPLLSLMSMQLVTAATLFTLNVGKCLQQTPGHISTMYVCVGMSVKEGDRRIITTMTLGLYSTLKKNPNPSGIGVIQSAGNDTVRYQTVKLL